MIKSTTLLEPEYIKFPPLSF